MTISMWKRDPRFQPWLAEGLREARDPLVEAAKNAICLKVLQGNSKFMEGFLVMQGYLGAGAVPEPGAPANVNQGVQIGQVSFHHVPVPLTGLQAAARQPPPGSNVITPAPLLAPMPVRPPA